MQALRRFRSATAAVLGVLISSASLCLSAATAPESDQARHFQKFATAPLYFESMETAEGSGGFIARSQDAAVVLAPTGATLILSRPDLAEPLLTGKHLQPRTYQTRALKMTLIGANPDARMTGMERLAGAAHYYIGNDQSEWRRGVPLFSGVRVDDVYPGVQLIYYPSAGARLEYDFVVQPHADPAQIAFSVEGAGRVFVDANGDLVMKAGNAEVRQQRPVIFQEIGGERRTVAGGFRLGRDAAVGFWIGAYDRSRPLIIDPILSFSTFVGGTRADAAWAVAANSTGVYVAGETLSKDLVAGAVAGHSAAYGGGVQQFGDGFVARYDTDGNLIYITYLGGRSADAALGIAADAAGNAFVTGYTDSTNFPVKPNPGVFATQLNTAGRNNNAFKLYPVDAFLTKLQPDGQLVFSTYFGGSGRDGGFAVAVDGAGQAYVTGMTESQDFPVTNIVGGVENVVQGTNAGRSDAFVVKFSADGTALDYATYLGGRHNDSARAIAVDGAGSAAIAGTTTSSDFPTWNAIEITNAQFTNGVTLTNLNITGGGAAFSDAFVARLTPDGSMLEFSTYLGGTANDSAAGIAIDGAGSVYVTGQTSSRNFPTNVIPAPRAWAGIFGSHAFVTKLDSAGNLEYSTEFGGRRSDQGTAIAVDSIGRAFVAGSASSANFFATNAISDMRAPLTNAIGKRVRFTGVFDGFLAVLESDGSAFAHSVFLGGSGNDEVRGVALDGDGEAYLAGRTTSPNFPTENPAQPVLGGGTRQSRLSDGFVLKISDLDP